MASAGFTLADRLGARTVPCSVTGCTRTWICLTGGASKLGGRPPAQDDDTASGMCEPCREKFRKLHDRQQPCARPGCTGSWTWPVMAQLESWAVRQQPPKALCAACEAELAQLQDVEMACAVPGCQRTAKVSARQQLLRNPAAGQSQAAPVEASAGSAAQAETPAAEVAAPVEGSTEAPAAEAPAAEVAAPAEGAPQAPAAETAAAVEAPARVRLSPEAMCGQCGAVYRKLRDRPVSCGINGCRRKWIWTAEEQIQAYAAGLTNEPPRRMCDECKVDFGNIADREVKCRTSGCKKTWTWTRSDQLDACIAGKPAPKAPARMCQSCLDIWSKLKDVERPCRRTGCERTWTDKRGAQLARAVRGKAADPYPRYCEHCEGELGELEDRVMPCKTENCAGTWVWSKAQQLAAGVRTPSQIAAEDAASGAPKGKRKKRREARPPERRCDECNEFLKDLKTAEIPCVQCGTPIFWPPESQLQEHRGNWGHPTLCGACKRDATEAARVAQREALRLSAAATFGHPASPAPAGENGEAAAATAAEAQAPAEAPAEASAEASAEAPAEVTPEPNPSESSSSESSA